MSELKTFDWGNGPVRLSGSGYHRRFCELRPTELHLKENGAKDGTASFVVGMEIPGNVEFYYGQVSFNMLRSALEELGFTLTRMKRIPLLASPK